ncbi:hypothetical protein ACFQ15_01635 [Sphingomonas hankookensis]|uniref:hypothetical protein n=1 Tax=Sphingomonas hankookensis TaxID=563996 RepID=UPI001F58BC78|nr:hypothetical protein [Sphingomonas hankookensis]
MTATPPPSGCLRIVALIVATMAGVVIVVLLWGVRGMVLASPIHVPALWFAVQQLWFVISVGWCVTLPFSLMIGLPLWHFAVRSGQQQRRDAVRFGLMIGTVMAVGGEWTGWIGEVLDFLGYCLADLRAGSIAHRADYSS